MKLNTLILKDKRVFNQFLGLKEHSLSVYSFQNIYIWKALFDIEWQVIEDCLCIFFKDNFGAFLYLTPQGKNQNPLVVKKAFEIMDSFNSNKDISRIENIEESDVDFYQNLGLECREKSCDYLCFRKDLAGLEGDKFKSKRASFNYFTKHYDFEYASYTIKDKKGCLKLYDHWMRDRAKTNSDPLYRGMLLDSRKSLQQAFDNYKDLDFIGGAVKINKEIKGFTFGFKLNKDTFCILYEITDLSIKGLAQFIFREFCRELKGFKYINIMDDSGLENLKKVKLSYHPEKLIRAYIAQRKDYA